MKRRYRKKVKATLVLMDVPVKKSLTLTVMQRTTRYIVHLKEGDTQPLNIHQLNGLAQELNVQFEFTSLKETA